MTANDGTEDDRKDRKGWLKSKPENEENTLGAATAEQPYNLDTDTDEEEARSESHQKTPPRTHAPRSSPHTADNNAAGARQTYPPSRKSP
jgi:hypothetical protein